MKFRLVSSHGEAETLQSVEGNDGVHVLRQAHTASYCDMFPSNCWESG